MTVSAATLEKLIAAGLTGAALVDVVRSIEADAVPAPQPTRSAAALRQARYRARKAEQSGKGTGSNRLPATESAPRDVERDADSDAPNDATPAPAEPLETKVSPTPPSKTQTLNPPSPPKGGSSPRHRGTRLPESWSPKPEHLAFAQERGRTPAWVQDEAEAMRGWAISNANRAVTLKSDWDRTFLEWMRRDAAKPARHANNRQNPANHGGQNAAPSLSDHARALRERIERLQNGEPLFAAGGDGGGGAAVRLLPHGRRGGA